MALHIEIGKSGERLAETFLAEKGFQILHKNWRYGRFEIDLIATKNAMLHFFEVKMRSSGRVLPEEAVNKKKYRSVMQAIEQYLHLYPQHTDFRFNILSIVHTPPDAPVFYLIEDVAF